KGEAGLADDEPFARPHLATLDGAVAEPDVVLRGFGEFGGDRAASDRQLRPVPLQGGVEAGNHPILGHNPFALGWIAPEPDGFVLRERISPSVLTRGDRMPPSCGLDLGQCFQFCHLARTPLAGPTRDEDTSSEADVVPGYTQIVARGGAGRET